MGKDSGSSSNDEDDFEDETLAERLWGLTEMFPVSIRNFTSSTVINSFNLLILQT